ncbi:glycosyltransferase family 2 protein [Trichocoleus sp. FACHB-262]|uniref:glycosyltransferase family 2 protein n=1 Tax=Trichocoleus sp. FACHB-262 TaxID=2692869 RepID=UPI001681F7CE|nr:glycosyltransferase [Trichocoleus sp. FACHB-262]MBD2119874.1 glycosyltransferase [Trichocoleus sp. FACHB-262]
MSVSEPQVTILVVQRERFSLTQRSLESIYANTTIPFKLIYVDGKSPRPIKDYLEDQAKQKGFCLIREEKLLAPNQARNLGLAKVDTKYVVIMDNDVLVTPGWLKNLVKCADETGAWVVGPTYLQGEIEDQVIHMAGGLAHYKQAGERRIFFEQHSLAGKKLPEVRSLLKRSPTELVEFHCLLIRVEAFEQLGLFDEKLLSSPEHVDLCLSVRELGQSVYFEPNAIVSYVLPVSFKWYDLPLYFLRWNDVWNRTSLEHFRKKRNLLENDPFIAGHYRWLTRHRLILFRPIRKFIQRLFPNRSGLKVVQLLDTIASYLFVDEVRNKTKSSANDMASTSETSARSPVTLS